MPNILPLGSDNPAIALIEPLGLSGNDCVGLPNLSTYRAATHP